MKPNIVSTKDLESNTRKNPATLMIESLAGEYKTMRDMANRYGVHLETMRRICRATDKQGNPKVVAPSSAAQQGGLLIYLFTDDDVVELDAYMTQRGCSIKES